MSSGVYIITNIINNKIYIGSTINFSKRWKKHKQHLNNNKHVYNKVLLTDVRDVIFQGDPFSLLDESYVYASIEPNIIRNCYWIIVSISKFYYIL